MHSLGDDPSCLAYSEILPDEKGATCAAFLGRAIAYFACHGITRIERLMTDIQSGWAASGPSGRPAGRIDVVRHLPVVVA